jgi:hypothetical protein
LWSGSIKGQLDSYEISKSHSILTVVEYGVGVAQITITEPPKVGWGAGVCIRNDSSYARVRARRNWSKVEINRIHANCFSCTRRTGKSERDGRDGCRARESIEARNRTGARILGPGDLGVHRIHYVRRTEGVRVALFKLISMKNCNVDSRQTILR